MIFCVRRNGYKAENSSYPPETEYRTLTEFIMYIVFDYNNDAPDTVHNLHKIVK